jgi:hypothetical protein
MARHKPVEAGIREALLEIRDQLKRIADALESWPQTRKEAGVIAASEGYPTRPKAAGELEAAEGYPTRP